MPRISSETCLQRWQQADKDVDYFKQAHDILYFWRYLVCPLLLLSRGGVFIALFSEISTNAAFQQAPLFFW